MTRKAFRAALHGLAGEEPDRWFAQHTPDEWIEALLVLWPQERHRDKGLWPAWIYGLVLFLLIGWNDRGWSRAALVPMVVFSLLVGVYILVWAASRRVSPIPLLERLDDIRLVPLWLEYLPRHGASRRLFLERLAHHLPAWHTTGEPLPERACAALLQEVRWLLINEPTSPAGVAFLTAALISLDTDASRGVVADPTTLRSLSVARLEGDPHVRAAAEDAVQRLSGQGV